MSPWRTLLLILALASTLLAAMYWPWPEPRPSGGAAEWPETDQAWLYDYLYNATKLGYDRSEWGGRLIETDDPAALADTRQQRMALHPCGRLASERVSDLDGTTAEQIEPP